MNQNESTNQNQYNFLDIDEVIATLNDKLIKFCLLYVINFNKTEAACQVGIKPTNAGYWGCLTSKKPNVSKYIQYLLNLMRMEGKVTKEDIIRQCTLIINSGASAASKISALNLIAKIQGYDYKKPNSIFGDGLVTINITKKTKEDNSLD